MPCRGQGDKAESSDEEKKHHSVFYSQLPNKRYWILDEIVEPESCLYPLKPVATIGLNNDRLDVRFQDDHDLTFYSIYQSEIRDEIQLDLHENS